MSPLRFHSRVSGHVTAPAPVAMGSSASRLQGTAPWRTLLRWTSGLTLPALMVVGLFPHLAMAAPGPTRIAPTSGQQDDTSPRAKTRLSRGLHAVKSNGELHVPVHQGQLITLPRDAASILIGDPSVANYQVPSANSVFVFGAEVGTTTLYAMDQDQQIIAAIDVYVEHDLSKLQEQINREVPGSHVSFETASSNGLIVKGSVRTPQQARQVIASVKAYLQESSGGSSGGGNGGGGGAQGGGGGGSSNDSGATVINQLRVEVPAQINIRVRVVEVSRTLTHDFGFNWDATLSGSSPITFATGSTTDFFDASSNSFTRPSTSTSGSAPAIFGASATGEDKSLAGLLSALSTEGLAAVLAEPNLTAMSGETAAFASGGEFPVVTITANSTNIDYKSYGVILRLTPTLLSPNRISLRIAPEVSELTDQGAVTLNDVTIPALVMRRAETTIELSSGQSFALAGLLRSTVTQSVEGVPGIKDIPGLGRLFESETSEHTESELVIIATAYVVDPVSESELQTPGKGLAPLDAQMLPERAAAGYLY